MASTNNYVDFDVEAASDLFWFLNENIVFMRP